MGKRLKIFGTLLLAAASCACIAVRLPRISPQEGALAAAGFILPGGAAQALAMPAGEDESVAPAPLESAPVLPSASSAPLSQPAAPSKAPASSAAPPPASGKAKTQAVPSKELGNQIFETDISQGGQQQAGIVVRNANTRHKLDVAAQLQQKPPLKIKADGTPMVLLYHTHTTEAYAGVTRTRDKGKSVVAVGEAVAASLRSMGIGVVHDSTIHDDPAFNGSYTRSAETMRRNLKKYPSIQVTLDIHRDTMTSQSGRRYKPTVLVNGKKACQIMIISGCDDDGSLHFPNWEQNLRLALRLQKGATEDFPRLMRPLNFGPYRYNEHMTPGSLLLEFGTEVNTLDEAKYAGTLFGKALARQLLALR